MSALIVVAAVRDMLFYIPNCDYLCCKGCTAPVFSPYGYTHCTAQSAHTCGALMPIISIIILSSRFSNLYFSPFYSLIYKLKILTESESSENNVKKMVESKC